MKKILILILLPLVISLSSCNKEDISNYTILENYYEGDINLSNKNLKTIPNFNKIATWSYVNEVVSINLLWNSIQILDWSMFKVFPNLQKISLGFNEISKFKNTDQLNVYEIDLSKNNITDLNGIWNLPKVQILNLNFNNISNVEELISIKSIISLHLAHNAIEEVNTLSKLTNMKELHIEFNKINNIDDLLWVWLYILTTAKNNLPEDLVKELNSMSLKNMQRVKD